MHRSTESTRSTIHCTNGHWASPSSLWIQTTKSNSKVYLQWNGRTFRPEGPVKLWTKMHCLNNAGRVDHPVWTTYIHSSHSFITVTYESLSYDASAVTRRHSEDVCGYRQFVCVTKPKAIQIVYLKEENDWNADGQTLPQHSPQVPETTLVGKHTLSYESLCKKLILKVRG